MLNPEIEERFKSLPPEYREFITSDFSIHVANTFGTEQGLSPEQISVYDDAIVLYLLFLIELDDITTRLSEYGINSDRAKLLTSSLEQSLPDFAKQTILQSNDLELDTLNQEIAEAEETFESVQGLRTMAGDASVVRHTSPPSAPVYQSSQADLLTRTPAAPTPAHTPPPPSWDTEA